MLRSAAETVVATTAQLAAGGVRKPVLAAPGHHSLQHAVILAESAYAQFQSEPKEPAVTSAGQDWQATLMAGHHTLWGRSGCWHRPSGSTYRPWDGSLLQR